MLKHLWNMYLFPLFLAIILIICTSCSFLKDDNPLEEIAEEIIENKIGVQVDFTPATPEK